MTEGKHSHAQVRKHPGFRDKCTGAHHDRHNLFALLAQVAACVVAHDNTSSQDAHDARETQGFRDQVRHESVDEHERNFDVDVTTNAHIFEKVSSPRKEKEREREAVKEYQRRRGIGNERRRKIKHKDIREATSPQMMPTIVEPKNNKQNDQRAP